MLSTGTLITNPLTGDRSVRLVKHPDALLAHRKSMFLTWLILSRLQSSKASTRFPAMSSRSTPLSLSSTGGMWGNELKESPRLQSCTRSPNSSGRELKRFPSRERVCRLGREITRRKRLLLNYILMKRSTSHASINTVQKKYSTNG